MKRWTLCATAALALAGCATANETDEVGPGPDAAVASAELRDASGRVMGSATASQIGDSIRIRVDGRNLPGGAHGAHIHQTGVCAAPDFASAGPHWNPTERKHGKDNPAGMHHGDLPNVLIGANGEGSLEYTIPGGRLTDGGAAMLDGDGASIVIHATADDYRTDPSGNSGGRIACGVFR
jgi:Cu-Zn family superoxide dismutase